jgi:predicted dehydrogenase/GNAT superfamily N-acetyltransferase
MQFHVPQSIAALKRGLHVLSEVPAGVSIDECRDLVLAARKSSGIYMMAENYTYIRQNAIVREIAARGLFGTPYFAEAEYIHELKALNEQTKWRRKWQTGIDGNTYPTHSLGPLLQWMPADRVVRLCCAGTGHHYKDPRGDYYEQSDSTTTLCRMASGGLVKLRLDMLSDRPHAMTNYQLQGTDGAYESSRAHGEPDRIWLRSHSRNPNQWINLKDLEAEFLPRSWRDASETAMKAGHGGGDYFEILDFVDSALGRRPPAIDIDFAMDMTLPGLVSQQSILHGSAWMDVPDSRQWQDESCRPRQQLRMVYRPSRGAPPVNVAPGYTLRQYRPSDYAQYDALMRLVGFGEFKPERVEDIQRRCLPGGFFVIEHAASGKLVATAWAAHNPSRLHPNGGSLEYVAADPDHKGHGLGQAVSAVVTRLLVERGYETIFLQTDDWRLPAIVCYLRLGYEPLMYEPDMPARWAAVHAELAKGK